MGAMVKPADELFPPALADELARLDAEAERERKAIEAAAKARGLGQRGLIFFGSGEL